MFGALIVALSALLHLQSALAQTTLVIISTSFTDDPTFTPSDTDTNVIESITQTEVNSPTITTTVALGPGPVNEPTFPATLTTCFLVSTQPTATQTEALDPTMSLPPGAQCYAFIREGGGVDEVPLFQVGSDGLTTPFAEPTSTSTFGNIQSTSSSSKKTGKIVGAVLGSVFGCILIGGILLWLRRNNKRRSGRRFSRATAWMRNRPGGWVADEKAPQHYEMQSQQSPSPPRPTHF